MGASQRELAYLVSIGSAESLRCVAETAAHGVHHIAACRGLLALGDAESLRCVAECAPDGSSEEAEANRRLEALGGA